MQPYFLPYIGYFQLMGAVDLFIVYDNIEYTKKGWINRNRMLCNGRDALFSLPLKGASDYLPVAGRELAADFDGARLLRQLHGAYRRAPRYAAVSALLEEIVQCGERNLFRFLLQALAAVCRHIGLATPIRIASALPIDHGLKGQDKVLALCRAAGADSYVNAIGGLDLYSRAAFAQCGIALHFLRPLPLEYAQFGAPFVPWLSIIDVLMFNPPETVRQWVASGYELI